MSKWQSEAIWRDALALTADHIRDCERPGFILYHRGALDEGHTRKYVESLRRRFRRIMADGLPEWKDRYAQGS